MNADEGRVRSTSRWLALAAVSMAVACGAVGPAERVALPTGWTTFVAADGLYELGLPPGAVLAPDARAFVPGDDNVLWTPEGAGPSVFSVLRRGSAVDLAEHLLDGDRADGRVEVEMDGAVAWRGAHGRRVRARVARAVARSWEEDPVSGAVSHSAEREQTELADFVAFRGPNSAIRVGYRLDRRAPAAVREAFATMLESFTLRRPLP